MCGGKAADEFGDAASTGRGASRIVGEALHGTVGATVLPFSHARSLILLRALPRVPIIDHRMSPLAITAFTATTAVGSGIDALTDALRTGRSGLRPNDYTEPANGVALPTWIGRVDDIESASLPSAFEQRDCRNHRLAWTGLQRDGFFDTAQEAIERLGADRVAVLIGTSTSTIEASEQAYRERAHGADIATLLAQPDLHHLHATTALIRDLLGASGPSSTISTACSSSAKVFAQAMRMIEVGIVDAVVVGGVDSLAASTLFGFNALGLVSSEPCRPFDARRDGISIGEAAGFALLERFDRSRHGDRPLLIGYGESSDAHHMSAPHPEGLGARIAIDGALKMAGVSASQVDYVNLHGTATTRNDAVEAALIASMFEAHTHASGTKGWTGHTLGAAGIVEAIVCLIALREGFMPGTLRCEERDPVCGPQIRIAHEERAIDLALSNAFAFGGNNCVLAFARDAAAYDAARTTAP
jgi:3-oxoacyl-[acyl-carrier-protein] synthase I